MNDAAGGRRRASGGFRTTLASGIDHNGQAGGTVAQTGATGKAGGSAADASVGPAADNTAGPAADVSADTRALTGAGPGLRPGAERGLRTLPAVLVAVAG